MHSIGSCIACCLFGGLSLFLLFLIFFSFQLHWGKNWTSRSSASDDSDLIESTSIRLNSSAPTIRIGICTYGPWPRRKEPYSKHRPERKKKGALSSISKKFFPSPYGLLAQCNDYVQSRQQMEKSGVIYLDYILQPHIHTCSLLHQRFYPFFFFRFYLFIFLPLVSKSLSSCLIDQTRPDQTS